MPVPFASVCELLEDAHQLCCAQQSPKRAVVTWFARNRTAVDAHDTDLAALLSTLLPEKRTDRVFFIQADALEKIIGRGLCISNSRIAELRRYRQPGSGVDLGDCAERILTTTPNEISQHSRVTVEEIDRMLHGLASRIKFSSPAIRESYTSDSADRQTLRNIYSRLTAVEAKWLTRLVLKAYQPVILDEGLIFRLCNPILPSVLQVQSDFSCALEVVQGARTRLLPHERDRASAQKRLLAQLKPKLGVKVGRQHWSQARSIKHCLSLGTGRMSVEDKIDGEYCQIHVDLSKPTRRIQIFSKSGKDSTEDKEALHGTIRASLDVDRSACRFSKGCILEGEVVVYSDHEKRIMPFHKIRNHITRRGLFLNTDQDSLPKAGEHLMVVYYDVLLLDDYSLLSVRHTERRKILANLVKCQLGWAELAKSEIVDFGASIAASSLRNIFAKTVVNKQEGLVLKVDEPYFDFSVPERPWSGRCIKFKKEYIGGFGDVGDFAVVGAGYDPVKSRQHSIAGLKWTHFYLGCLSNQKEVERWSAMPEFTVVNVVELNKTQLRSIVQCGNPVAVPVDDNDKFCITIQPGIWTNPAMSSVFTQPLVFDLRCFSFDKVGNTGFWSPRFPVVSKVHLDRGYMDALSFQDLQRLAKEATTVQEQPDSQENLAWIAKLEVADPRGVAVDAASQLTVTTMPTPSPRRSTQSSSQSWSLSPAVPLQLTRSATQPAISTAAHCEDVPNLPAPQPRPHQLITPPTSSDPLPPSPKQQEHKQPQKRSSPTLSQSLERPKRRKSSEDKHRLANSLVSKADTRKTKRAPLTEVDVNSSQRSTSNSQRTKSRQYIQARMSQQAAVNDLPSASQRARSQQSNREKMSPNAEVIDLTTSPGASFETVPSKPTSAPASPNRSEDSGNTTLEAIEESLHVIQAAATSKDTEAQLVRGAGQSSASVGDSAAEEEKAEESQPVTLHSQDSDYINLFVPGWDSAMNGEEASQPSRAAAESQVHRDNEVAPTSQADDKSTPTAECKYAAGRCYLSKSQVFLAPLLARPTEEAVVLLKDHGINNVSTDFDGWLEDDHRRALANIDRSREPDTVLLVNSLEHHSEVEALCKHIHEMRSQLDDERCNYIKIYDWRMLRYLKIHEDDTVTKKYYDGFGSAFVRWFVALL